MARGFSARWLAARLAAALALVCAAPLAAQTMPYRSLTQDFTQFAAESAGLPMADRVVQFKQRFGRLFPAFYRPRDGRSAADFDRMIARSLSQFSADRAGYESVERNFSTAYLTGIDHFRQAFPNFRPTLPVYFLHGLGEMDAGTRMLGKRRVLIFAADGIARYDSADSVPMLLDHEFFHLVHRRYFPGCYAVWCTLWREGLAVHAAATLNPGATDRQLGLSEPAPLRPAVDSHMHRAICLLQSRLGATDRPTNRMFFLANGGNGALPPRFGYYLGYRIAQRAGQTQSLQSLMAMPMGRVRGLVSQEVAAMADEAGGCLNPATTIAQAAMRALGAAQ